MFRSMILFVFVSLMSAYGYAQFTYTQITNGLTDVYEGGSMNFAIGDIDNDGDLDIISVGDHSSPLIPQEHGIMVIRNNGNGTSWSKTMNGDFGYGGVALGDVNNDGIMDVAYGIHHNYSPTDFGNQVLEVVLGDGTANVWTPYDDSLGMQGQSWGMAGCDFGDVNNDGLLDLGANSFGCCDGVWIYKNNGDGSWSTYAGALNLNSSGIFRFADFNKDGKADFVANNTQFENQNHQVWMNLGNAQFAPMQDGISFLDDYFMFDLADVNLDGAPDIAFCSYGIPYVYTYDVVSNTWISISSGLPTTNQNLWHIAMGDMDADGDQDLVTIKNNLITIYTWDGNGNWTQAATLNIPETICRDIKLADLDHNGRCDIVYWAEYNNTSMLRVYLNNTPASELSIWPISPIGSEKYCQGSVNFIRWNSSVPGGDVCTVSLELSTTGVSGPFVTIEANLPNSGNYQWLVPGLLSGDCYIRYTIDNGSSSVSEISAIPFTIDSCGNSIIIPGSVTGNDTLCPGDIQTYTVPFVPDNTGYTWTLPPGWTGSSTSESIQVVASNQGGVISVTASFLNGNSIPLSMYVTVNQIDTAVTQNGITLNAVPGANSYQWIDCSNSSMISGANAISYTPAQDGIYAVMITKGNCVDTSACHTVFVTGVLDNEQMDQVRISPNPTDSKVKISCSTRMDKIEIYDVIGARHILLECKSYSEVLDVISLPAGLYFVKVFTNNKQVFRQIVKTK